MTIETETAVAHIQRREFEDALRLIQEIEPDTLKRYVHKHKQQKVEDTEEQGCKILELAVANIISENEPAIVLLKCIVKKCPSLLTAQRSGPYNGQTPLHTLVSRGNEQAVEAVFEEAVLHAAGECYVKKLLETSCDGTYFEDTVMMGQLPLSIAALTFDKKMVELLLDKKAQIKTQNTLGDTVFHSLIRYSHSFPEKQDLALDMMSFLHQKLYEDIEKKRQTKDALQSTWLIENHKEHFTALKLAAYLSQSKLFTYIFELPGVYCHWGGSFDGLFNTHLYDITEIDSAANTSLLRKKRKEKMDVVQAKPNQTEPIQQETMTEKPKPTNYTYDVNHRVVSVFEILYETQRANDTFDILTNPVIETVLNRKWKLYRKYFYIWLAMHVSAMVMLSAYIVKKSEVISAYLTGSTVQPSTSEKTFVTVSAILSCIISVGIVGVIGWHTSKTGFSRKRRINRYKWLLFVFAVCLSADSIWYWSVQVPKNYFLIVALLIGWWFMTFFLRPFRKFAFFTVMLRKILAGDMIRFSSIILLKLVGFTLVMHTIFILTAGPPLEDFSTVWRTALTMFKLLLGLEEMQMLYEAPEPWLAITIFSVFVLLTYVLMLNSLIALMSSTAAEVEKNKEKFWMSQKLAVLMVIEAALPEMLIHVEGFSRNFPDSGTRYLFEARSLPKDLTAKKKVVILTGLEKEKMAEEFTGTGTLSLMATTVSNLMTKSDKKKKKRKEKRAVTFTSTKEHRAHGGIKRRPINRSRSLDSLLPSQSERRHLHSDKIYNFDICHIGGDEASLP